MASAKQQRLDAGARSRGFPSYYAERKARQDPNVVPAARTQRAHQYGYTSTEAMRRARQEGRPAPRDPAARTMTPVQTPAGRIAGSGSPEAIRREIERLAAAGARVAIQATFDTPAGPKTRYLDSPPTALIREAQAAAPGSMSSPVGLGAPVAPRQGAGLGAPVQIISGPAVSAGGAGGVPAADVLALIEAYDWDEDPWAWLADWYDSEY